MHTTREMRGPPATSSTGGPAAGAARTWHRHGRVPMRARTGHAWAALPLLFEHARIGDGDPATDRRRIGNERDGLEIRRK